MDLGFSFPADENLHDESELDFRLEVETGVRGLEGLMADPPLRSRSRRADGADIGGEDLPVMVGSNLGINMDEIKRFGDGILRGNGIGIGNG